MLLVTAGCGGAASSSALGSPSSGAGASTASDGVAAKPKPIPICADDDLVGCKEGCDAGRAEDCAALGTLYLKGEHVPADSSRATSLLTQACDGGSARGCLRLADLERSTGGPTSTEAVGHYRRACERGANTGCVSAGLSYRDGEGVAADSVFAAVLFDAGCRRGSPPSCYELAIMALSGDGIELSRNLAEALFDKACQLGEPRACYYFDRVRDGEDLLEPTDDEGDQPVDDEDDVEMPSTTGEEAGDLPVDDVDATEP